MFEIIISKLNSHPYLSVPYLGIWLIFPFIALISCWMHKEKRLLTRYIWTLAIVVSWPVGAWVAAIYGFFWFNKGHAKFFSLAAFLLMCALFIMPGKSNLSYFSNILKNKGFSAAKPYIDANINGNVFNSKIRDELSENFSALSQEYTAVESSDDQKKISINLANYMAAILENNLSDKEYKNWHSLFFWRKEIKNDMVEMLIKSNRAAEIAAERKMAEFKDREALKRKDGKKRKLTVAGTAGQIDIENIAMESASTSKIKLTANDKEKIKRTLNNMGSTDNLVIENSIFFFELLGEDSTPYLVSYLEDNQDNLIAKKNVIYTLGRLGPKAYNAVPRMVQFLRDEDEHTRAVTAIALGKIGERAVEAVPILAITQYDDDKWVSQSAYEALLRIGTDKAKIAAYDFRKGFKPITAAEQAN